MTSNYPPGVTGGEPQIAGWAEGVEQRECSDPLCAFDGVVDVTYGPGVIAWTCPDCGYEHDDPDDGDDDHHDDHEENPR